MHRSPKIKSLDELATIVMDLRAQGKTVVHCHGTFDLMHPGHIEHFRSAKEQGDVLIVTVTVDRLARKGPGRPVFNEHLRMNSIASLDFVDFVAPDDFGKGPPLIQKLKPNVYIKGQDYTDAAETPGTLTYAEKEAVEEVGGRLHITHNDVVFSSTELLNRHFSPFADHLQDFLEEFRKKYDIAKLSGFLDSLRNEKVLVIGDTIIDEYHYCKPLGMSAKEIMISVNYEGEESFLGGAAATANHVAGFCKEVGFFSILAKEHSREAFVRSGLKENVVPHFVYRDDGPTVAIRRYIEKVFLKKYFQLYFHNPVVTQELDHKIAEALDPLLDQYSVVLVNDFGLGFLSKESIARISKKAKFLAVNTQTNSSNRGFNLITKYPRADYVCVDEPEIRLAAHSKHDSIENLAQNMAEILRVKACTVTLGHLGALTYDVPSNGFFRIPVFSQRIVDRVGAGDAFFSITAPLVAKGVPMDAVGFIGNTMGAIAVTIVGNERSIEKPELTKWITTLLK